MKPNPTGNDLFDLARFVNAQQGVYERALAELRAGRKQTHWMWFIFPQIDGLGLSSTTKQYAVKSLQEAQAYLQHPSSVRACELARQPCLALRVAPRTTYWVHPMTSSYSHP